MDRGVGLEVTGADKEVWAQLEDDRETHGQEIPKSVKKSLLWKTKEIKR